MLITLADLEKIREKHKGEKIVLGGGAFDLIHQGHIQYLQDIKKLGDILVVAVKSNAEVKSYKNEGQPIQDESVRAAVLDAIRYVDYTLVAPEQKGGEPPRLAVARALRPDILVSGNDKWKGHEDELRALGVTLALVPIEKVNSTTSIIERIRALKT